MKLHLLVCKIQPVLLAMFFLSNKKATALHNKHSVSLILHSIQQGFSNLSNMMHSFMEKQNIKGIAHLKMKVIN